MSVALRVPAMVVWLTVLWLALWGGLSWANLLSGLAVAVTVTTVAHTGSQSTHVSWFRPQWAIWYAFVVLGKLIESNLRLAWEILTPGIGTHTAIIAVPMRGGSDAVINLVANSITLTPGTMTVDVIVHESRRDAAAHRAAAERPGADAADIDAAVVGRVTLYVHGMYAKDTEAVRHEILELEALALRAFGSPDDYLHAEADVVAHLPLLGEAASDRATRRAHRRAARGRGRTELLEMDTGSEPAGERDVRIDRAGSDEESSS